VVDPVRYRSDRLPTDHFDARFSDDNLRFWVPVLVAAARIGAGDRVLDVGCGTGGFTRGIADAAAAEVTGCDVSARFIEEARRRPAPARGRVDWVVADAERLPLPSSSFDRVLLSMVLHQLADPAAGVHEAFRVLRRGGVVLVRTIAPEDVHERVPERYLLRMAAVDEARLQSLDLLRVLLEAAGFVVESVDRVLRNKVLSLAEQEQELLTEARSRYEFLTEAELAEAVRRMREDAAASEGDWIDPRPTMFVVASKPL
jgi:ubiquinone/menaquinone biosynthesis C-methylase UbiE